jgi:hypothetical protein
MLVMKTNNHNNAYCHHWLNLTRFVDLHLQHYDNFISLDFDEIFEAQVNNSDHS